MSEPREIELTGVDGSRWAIGGPIQGPGGKDSDAIPVLLDNSYTIPKSVRESWSDAFEVADEWWMDGPNWRQIAEGPGFDTGETPLE